MIFSNLDLTKVTHEIRCNSNKGPTGYNPLPIIRAFLAQQLENIATRKDLIKRLNQDSVFRHACGFGLLGKIPSEATFCRYYQRLNYSDALNELYLELIDQAMELDLIDVETMAIDSTKLEGYERAKPKSKIDKNNPDTPDWGAKLDSHNNKITWFGWKVHAVCDAKSELPLAFKITPANETDHKHALSLVDDLYKLFKDNNY